MKFQVGYITDTPTTHRIGLPQSEVFQNPDDFKEWFAPVLSVDLSVLNPEWTGQVHFLYFHHEFDSVNFTMEDSKYVALLEDFEEPDTIPVDEFPEIFEEDEDFEDLSQLPMGREDGRQGKYVAFMEFELPELNEEIDVFDWKEEVNPVLEKANEGDARGQEKFETIENVFLGGHPWWIQSPGGLGNYGEGGWYFVGQLYIPFFSSSCFGYYQYLYYNPSQKKVMIENYHT